MDQEDICSSKPDDSLFKEMDTDCGGDVSPSNDSSPSLSSYDLNPILWSDSDASSFKSHVEPAGFYTGIDHGAVYLMNKDDMSNAARAKGTLPTSLRLSDPSNTSSNVLENESNMNQKYDFNDAYGCASESLQHQEATTIGEGAPRNVPPQEVPSCPWKHHGSSDMLLNILLKMQQQQQQHMALLQQQLAAQQQQTELQQQYFLEPKKSPAPTFGESTGLLEAEKWLTEMEIFCRALCIPMDEWVNVMIPLLVADAEAWFNSVKPTYESGGRGIDWAQFQDMFYLKYIPATIRTEKVNEFFNLKQARMTVIQYASMVRFVPVFMVHERRKITRFKEGLNLNLRECMGTDQATTYQELLEHATERLIRERNQIRDIKRPRPWNEQNEETESVANKKAIQEDLDGSTVHGQDNENSTGNSSHHAASQEQREVDEKETRVAEEQKKQIEALQKRIIQLEKDLDKKRSLHLDFEQLQGQLDIMKHTDIEILEEAEKLKKLLTEKEAELEHQKNQQEGLHKRIIQLVKDLDKKQSVDVEQVRGLLLNVKRELIDDDDSEEARGTTKSGLIMEQNCQGDA